MANEAVDLAEKLQKMHEQPLNSFLFGKNPEAMDAFKRILNMEIKDGTDSEAFRSSFQKDIEIIKHASVPTEEIENWKSKEREQVTNAFYKKRKIYLSLLFVFFILGLILVFMHMLVGEKSLNLVFLSVLAYLLGILFLLMIPRLDKQCYKLTGRHL